MRFLLLLAPLLLGAARPETRVMVALPPGLAPGATGRLLLFAAPATPGAPAEAVDVGGPPNAVTVAARDAGFGPDGTAILDTAELAYPAGLDRLPPGDYRVQAVLDRNGDYAYAGRGPGDLVSAVATWHLPLAAVPTLPLVRALPSAPAQFDTAGLPPVAAAQIAASRPHLHDEAIPSPALSRFRGTPQRIAAWVLTPPGYDARVRRTWPTVYTAGGFGTDHRSDGQQLSKIWHLMETGVLPPMIWVALDHGSPVGTTEFADSVNTGPWDEALVADVIPALEARYRMDARPTGRFLTGHSSGGWFALWTLVRHPALFGGAWATSPDPVDFHDFLGADLSVPGANLFRDPAGRPRPLERDGTHVNVTVAQQVGQEEVLGRDGDGGQVRSFEWVFSPRGADGRPLPLFDRRTGAVDADVAAYWRDRYDIGHRIAADWPRLRRDLDTKIHLRVGTLDSFYLDGAVRRLEAVLRGLGARADVSYAAGASHSMGEVYAVDGDRTGYWRRMGAAMQAVARPAR